MAQRNVKWISKSLMMAASIIVALSSADLSAQEFNRFLQLFQRGGESDPTLASVEERYQKMETIRSTAQGSLEKLKKLQPANVDLELRYGELMIERGRDLELYSGELSGVGEPKRATETHKISRDLLKQGLARESKLLKANPNHPMVPRVYLSMARSEYALGNKGAALTDADLGLRAQNSRKSDADTKLQLLLIHADSAFDLAKPSLALASLEQAKPLATTGSIEHSYVVYKLAWVHYNLKDPVTALKHLDDLFEQTGDKLALRSEAVKDYALFAADLSKSEVERIGGFEGLVRHLAKFSSKEQAATAGESFAKTLAKTGRGNEAITAYEFLISSDPKSRRNLDRALQVIEWTEAVAQKSKVSERYLWLVKEFGPESLWLRSFEKDKEFQVEVLSRIEERFRSHALGLHKMATKDGGPEHKKQLFEAIAELYDTYLSRMLPALTAQSPEHLQIIYYRGEILESQGQKKLAAETYDKFLDRMASQPASGINEFHAKLVREASTGSIELWSKILDSKDTEFSPELAAHMTTAVDRFTRLYPKDAKCVAFELAASQIEIKAKHEGAAIDRLQSIVTNFPKHKDTLRAVNGILDLLNKTGNLALLDQKAQAFLESSASWANGEQVSTARSDLQRIVKETKLQRCEQLGKTLEAAICFESLSRALADDAIAPKSLIRAAGIYDELGKAQSADAALEILVSKYPQSEAATGGMARLAQHFEKNFEFTEALSMYRGLVKRLPAGEERSKVAIRILTLAHELGLRDDVLAGLKDPVVPGDLKRKLANRKLREELRKNPTLLQVDVAKLSYPIPFAMDADLDLELRRRHGLALAAAKKLDEADKVWMSALKTFWKASPKTPELWDVAAHIRLDQGSYWERQFYKTELASNPNRKAELFQKLDTWYAEVITMKSPSAALDALWALSEMTRHLAGELKKLGQPDGEILKKSALIDQQIAQKAIEWKLVTPTVLKAAARLQNREIDAKDLHFAWQSLPRWISAQNASSDFVSFTERSTKDLEGMLKSESKRSIQRELARALLLKSGSLKSPTLAKWSSILTDQSGVQLRIQAMINDGTLETASLFLSQYEDLFGKDAFALQMRGHVAWKSQDFQTAQSIWNSANTPDFETAYWKEGWQSSLVQLDPNSKTKATLNDTLASSAKLAWQKALIQDLCRSNSVSCTKDQVLSPSKTIELVRQARIESPIIGHEFENGSSGFEIRRSLLSHLISAETNRAQKLEDLGVVREALGEFFTLSKDAIDDGTIRREHAGLKASVDKKQEELEHKSAQSYLAQGGHQ